MQASTGDLPWLVHICPRQDWEQAQRSGEYRAASLASEGFIHCSTPAQVLWVANTFYRDAPDLVLLWIDAWLLHSKLRWEAAEAQRFPHIYGALNLDAVRQVSDFRPAADGKYDSLPDPPAA